MQRFTGTGSFLSTWNIGGFWHPTGVAVDGGNNVYVSDNGNQVIRTFACP